MEDHCGELLSGPGCSSEKAEKDLAEVTIADEESDEVCELCGRRMVIKYGPHGRFLACPDSECRNTKPYFEKIGVACPKCGKDIVMKKTKKGRRYYGCIDNPECDFMVWQKPSGEKCPAAVSCCWKKVTNWSAWTNNAVM